MEQAEIQRRVMDADRKGAEAAHACARAAYALAVNRDNPPETVSATVEAFKLTWEAFGALEELFAHSLAQGRNTERDAREAERLCKYIEVRRLEAEAIRGVEIGEPELDRGAIRNLLLSLNITARDSEHGPEERVYLGAQEALTHYFDAEAEAPPVAGGRKPD